jgi:diguanylate cyclase (GGDEF)-like protein
MFVRERRHAFMPRLAVPMLALMTDSLEADWLLEIIRTQNEIAASSLDLQTVMELVVQRARVLTGSDAAVIELAEGEEMVYHVVAGTATGHEGMRLRIETSLSGLCVRLGETLHCEDASRDDRVDAEACRLVGAMSMICVPLVYHGQATGALKVYDSRPALFGPRDVRTLDLLSGIIAAHMSHARFFQEILHQSRHDPLTGLQNRRALEERLADELARVRRRGGELAVCALDLDRFKRVNDTYGHATGDLVLRAVGGHLGALRTEDGAYRLGGDEFALVLVDATRDGAESVLRRLATRLQADRFCRGVGLSWGLAAHEPGDGPTSILARADEALYRAKHRSAA